MRIKMENNDIPFQVEHLIKSLLNGSEDVNIRGNYKIRLMNINQAINQAIKEYDQERTAKNFSSKIPRKKNKSYSNKTY